MYATWLWLLNLHTRRAVIIAHLDHYLWEPYQLPQEKNSLRVPPEPERGIVDDELLAVKVALPNVMTVRSLPSKLGNSLPLLQAKCRWITGAARRYTRRSWTDINDHAVPLQFRHLHMVTSIIPTPHFCLTRSNEQPSGAWVDPTGPSSIVCRSWWGREFGSSPVLFDNYKRDVWVVAGWYDCI